MAVVGTPSNAFAFAPALDIFWLQSSFSSDGSSASSVLAVAFQQGTLMLHFLRFAFITSSGPLSKCIPSTCLEKKICLGICWSGIRTT